MNTVFHKIVAGELPAHIIHEDDHHMAFLDIFPTHKGQTVVIPKKHTTSKFAETQSELLASTTLFAQQVAQKLEATLEDVIRVQVVIEGFEVDYLHIKLLPAYKLPEDAVHHSAKQQANDTELAELARQINAQ